MTDQATPKKWAQYYHWLTLNGEHMAHFDLRSMASDVAKRLNEHDKAIAALRMAETVLPTGSELQAVRDAIAEMERNR